MRKAKGLAIGILMLCCALSAQAAGIFRVDAASTATIPDGQTWATAYKTLQAGTDAASAAGGGEVWIKAGTYTGTKDPVLTMKSSVQLYGGFWGGETSRDERDWNAHPVLVDGQNLRRCMAVSTRCSMDGLTITRGYSSSSGGGVNIDYSDGSSLVVISNCCFSGNSARSIGGAIYASVSDNGGSGKEPALIVSNCIFTGNTAGNYGGAVDLYAYAHAYLYQPHSPLNGYVRFSPSFSRCVFSANSGPCVRAFAYASTTEYPCKAVAHAFPTFEHCTFYSSGVLTDCGSESLGGTVDVDATASIAHSILWAGGNAVAGNGICNPTVSNSCIEGGYSGNGNTSVDPQFVSAPNDLRLQAASPCIGPGADDDLGAYEFTGCRVFGGILINNNAMITASPQVTLSLNWSSLSGSPVTDMRFSDDGAHWTMWEPVAATRAYTLPGPDGYHTVRVQFRDGLHNVSDRLNDYIMLDATPPTGTIVINNGASSTKNPEVTLSLTWSDGTGSGVTRMRFSDNGSTWTAWEPLNTTKTHTLPLPPGGYQTVRVQFRDGAGNYSARLSDYIRLDLP